jgi:hypothetical protein
MSTLRSPNPDSLPVPWRVGEHVACAGDTGTGKTYLISRLVRLREFVVFFRVKPDDIELPGFERVRTAAALESIHSTHVLLDPRHDQQMREGVAMLNKVWEMGGWTICIDEQWYAEKMLYLGRYVDRLLTQGRSKNISVVIGMQRPAQISRFTISQATHVFSFILEGRDIQIMKEATTPRIVEPIETLTGHDFVYYNRRKRLITTGNARALGKIFTVPSWVKAAS